MGDGIKSWHDDMDRQEAWKKSLSIGNKIIVEATAMVEAARDTYAFTADEFNHIRAAIAALDKVTGNPRKA